MIKLKDSFKAKIYIGLCIFFWAFIPVVAKLGQKDLDNHQFLFWSNLISFLTLLFATFLGGKAKYFREYDRRAVLNSAFLGFLGGYLYYILLYFGYASMKGLEVLVLQYTWPIFIVILAPFILREKINLRKIIAIFFGFFGVMVILSKGNIDSVGINNIRADLAVIIGAFFYALFSVLGKKFEYEQFTKVTILFLAATVVSFLSMIVFSSFKMPVFDSLAPILANGIFINGISYVFWFKALNYGDASKSAQAIFFVPVLASVLLLLIFKEEFLPVYFAGFIFILFSNFLVQNESGN